MTSRDQLPESLSAEQGWLQRFLLVFLLLQLALMLLGAAHFALTRSPVSALGVLVWGGAVPLLLRARGLVRRGQLLRAATTLNLTLVTLGLVAVAVRPTFVHQAALLPLIGLTLALPHLTTRTLRLFVAGAWLAELAIYILSRLLPRSFSIPPFERIVGAAVLLINFALLIWLLGQHYVRMRALLDQSERANDELRVTRANLETLVAARTAELRTVLERYAAISQMTSDYVFALRIEADGSAIREWSQSGQDDVLGGYSKALIDAHVNQFHAIAHADDAPILQARRAHVLAGQDDVSEFRIVGADGEVRWVRCYIRPLADAAHGRVTRVLGALQDITERKRAEEALRESEARYQAVSELTSDYTYMITVDEEGRQTDGWATGAFLCITGYTVEEILALGFRPILHPDDRETNLRRAARVMAGNDDVCELRIITKQGQVRWLRAFTRPLYDAAAGRVTRVLGAMRDITAQKQAELELTRSEERYRQLIELLPDAVVVHCDGIIVFANAATLRLFGAASPEDLVGTSVYHRFHPDYYEVAEQRLHQILVEGTTTPLTAVAFLRLDGSPITVETTACRVDYNGAPAVLAVLRDISERRRVEAEQRALEHKLQETQRLESLGILAGGIAHDFNNLLTGIMGNASLAQMDLLPDSPAYECFVHIELASKRAAELTRQMLDYAGKGRFTVEPVEINYLILEMVQLLHASISKDITLDLRLAHDLPQINADASQIRQVVMNLVVNAAEAIGEAPGTITLTTRVVYADDVSLVQTDFVYSLHEGDYVFLEVVDSGIGMASEVRSRIFDPFFTTKFTGRGLGLAAVLGIIRSHGGTLKVESEPGAGTTFTILLPAYAGAPAVPGALAHSTSTIVPTAASSSA